MDSTPHPDWKIVIGLGGPVKVADLLGWNKDGGVQRIQNWKYRGIPAAVKLQRADLFQYASDAGAGTIAPPAGARRSDRPPTVATPAYTGPERRKPQGIG